MNKTTKTNIDELLNIYNKVNIKNKQDSDNSSDSDESEEEVYEHQNKIDNWYNKKIKLNSKEDLEIIKSYLIFNDIKKEIIKISSDYIFEYYNLSRKQLDKLGLRCENVFKLNIVI